jgi:hypothetical protein
MDDQMKFDVRLRWNGDFTQRSRRAQRTRRKGNGPDIRCFGAV